MVLQPPRPPRLLVGLPRLTDANGSRTVAYAVLRGRRVSEAGSCALDALKDLPGWSLRASIDSPMNLAERVRLRALSRRFVPVLAQRHLAQSGSFSDRFRSRAHVVSLRDGEAEVDLVAMLEDDAEMAIELLPARRRPLTHLLGGESAVAALVGAATAQPVLVHWWRDGVLGTLLVQQGRVAWHLNQSADLDDASGTGWASQLEAAASAASASHGSAPADVLRLGPGPWARSGDWAPSGSSDLAAKLGALLRGIAPESVLQAPALYGLAFANGANNLVVNGHAQQVAFWRWGHRTALATGCAGLVLAGAGALEHLEAGQRAARAASELQRVEARLAALQPRLPAPAAVTALQSAVWRDSAAGATLRVDAALAALIERVPAGAHLERVQITRQERPGARAGKAAAAELTAADYALDVSVRLPGEYPVAKRRAEELTSRLAELGTLSGTRFSFEDPVAGLAGAAAGGVLSTRLTVPAGAL